MSKLSTIETDIEAMTKRLAAAVEAWYARHFHRATKDGIAPISSTDKADLHQAVAAAVKPSAVEQLPASTSKAD